VSARHETQYDLMARHGLQGISGWLPGQPDSSSRAATTIEYAFTTHDREAGVVPASAARILGSASAMIVTSIATMKTATETTASVSQAGRDTRSILHNSTDRCGREPQPPLPMSVIWGKKLYSD